MKHDTSALEGDLLNMAVALAVGARARTYRGKARAPECYDVPFDTGPSASSAGDCFDPCHEWAHAGPIIEREKIVVIPDDPDCSKWVAFVGGWMSHDYIAGDCASTGPTYLVAAMRAFVRAKLGDEVEIA